MKNRILFVLFVLIGTMSEAQKKISWEDLAQVEFSEKFFPAYGETFLLPHFSNSVTDLKGKLVSIKGYFLNIDPKGELYILSKGPMSACFFCGVGGPETAIELQFDSKQDYITDTLVTVIGRLELNKLDIEHFNYILTDCKVIIDR